MPASRNSMMGTAMAVAAFLLIVGGLTWFMHYMPSRGTTATPIKPSDPVREVLRFKVPAPQQGPLHAVWELKPDGTDGEYILESEKGEKGEYCFLFQNVLDGTAEVELDKAACDCTRADIGVVPYAQWQQIAAVLAKQPWAKPVFTPAPDWQSCTRSDHTGIKIPGGGYGILRIHWDGRKDPGSMLNLDLKFWHQPEGNVGSRQITRLIVPVRVVYPLQFEPSHQDVGLLSPGEQQSRQFHVWSATRAKLDVAFRAEEKDPLFTITSKPLDASKCPELQERLRNRKVNDKPAPIPT